MNDLSRLPVQVQQEIYAPLLRWTRGPSPELLKAARCSRELYGVVIQTFRRVNTFYVGDDVVALQRLSPPALREILKIVFTHCDSDDPAKLAKLFDDASKATSVMFLFKGQDSEYRFDDYGKEVFYPFEWFQAVLPKFKSLKSITLICPTFNYPIDDEEQSMEDEPLGKNDMIEFVNAKLGVEADEDRMSEDAKKIVQDVGNIEKDQEEEDAEDSDIQEIEQNMFVWTANKDEYLRLDQEA